MQNVSRFYKEINLTKTSFLSGKVELLVPKTFTVMPEEWIMIKYPAESRPTIIYSDERGMANVTLSHTQDKIASSELVVTLESMRDMFNDAFPTAHWCRSSMEQVNGMEVGVLELFTPAIDTQIYNLMWFTSLEGRLLIATFNCTIELIDDWVIPAKYIMESFKVKNPLIPEFIDTKHLH